MCSLTNALNTLHQYFAGLIGRDGETSDIFNTAGHRKSPSHLEYFHFVLVMESIASRHRIKYVIAYQMFYGLGGLVLVGMAYSIRHFRTLQLAITLPLIPMLAYRV